MTINPDLQGRSYPAAEVYDVGRAIAEAFAADGCAVMVTAKTREEIERAPAFSQGIHAHVLDIAEPERFIAETTGLG